MKQLIGALCDIITVSICSLKKITNELLTDIGMELSSPQILLVTILLLLTTIFLLKKSKLSKKYPKPLPPTAPTGYRETAKNFFSKEAPWFLMGHARTLQSPIYRLNLIPSITFVVIGDPKIARQILDDPKSTKPSRAYQFFDRVAGGDNFFSAEGHRWKHVRKAVAPAFSSSQVDRMMTTCESVLKEWITKTLEPKVQSKEPLDVALEMQRITVRFITKAAFEYDATDDEIQLIFESFTTAYRAYTKRPNPLRRLFPSSELRRAKQATNDLLSISHRMIRHYRKNPTPTKGTVIDLIDTNPSYQSDEEKCRDIVVFLAGGFDTTAVTLSWTLLELSRNPKEQIKLRKDLRKSGSNSAVLKRIIKETFRLHPSAALGSARIIHQTIDTGSYIIPKGSVASIPMIVLHRNTQIFNQPDTFFPDRWIDPSDEANRALIPFSTGRRNCVGQALANAELNVILAKLCKEYEFEIVEEGVVDYFVTLKPVGVRLLAKRVK